MSKPVMLFKDDPIPVENMEIPVAKIDDLIPEAATIVARPETTFVESVKQHGVIQPIVLIKQSRGKKYDLAFGRRRIIAAKIAELETIPARVFPPGTTKASVLALVENTNRKRNILSEWQAVESLIAEDMDEEEIFSRTGLTKIQQRQLLQLRNLIDPLRRSFEEGKIKPALAQKASKQKKSVQKRLASILSKEGKLKADDFASVRRTVKNEIASTLPNALFGTEEEWFEVASRRLGTLQRDLEGSASRAFLERLGHLIEYVRNASR